MRVQTTKQLAWVEAMLTNVTPTEAARMAKYAPNTHKQRGHENVTNSYLMRKIDKRREQLRAKTGYTIAQAQKEYEEARLLAMTCRQPAAAATAITGKARLYGMDKDANIGEKTVIIISPKVSKVIDSKEIGNG